MNYVIEIYRRGLSYRVLGMNFLLEDSLGIFFYNYK